MDMESIGRHNQEWLDWAVEQIVMKLSLKYDRFTSDELRSKMVKRKRFPAHQNTIGVAFKIAAQLGMIERVGFTRSMWPTNNHRMISVWKGTVQ
jgi:hypothetical protein